MHTLRSAADHGIDGRVIVCGKQSAYIEGSDPALYEQVDCYDARLQVVDDLTEVIDDDVLRIAVYDFVSAEHSTLPHLAAFTGSHKVTVSGEFWLDVNTRTAKMAHAISALQTEFGITPAQTMVFGDFLNDLETMDTADYPFACTTRTRLLLERAKFVAPSNNDNGVVRTIDSVLDIPLG